MSSATAEFAVVQTVESLDSANGGVSMVVPRLADAVHDRGCPTAVVFTSRSGAAGTPVLPERANSSAARTVGVGRHLNWSLRYAAHIDRGFDRPLPRLLHDNGLWRHTNYLAARYAFRHKVPLVISPHGMLEPWALNFRPLRKAIVLKLFQRKALESAAMFMATAEAEYAAIRSAGLRQPVAVVPAGVSVPAKVARAAKEGKTHIMLFLSRIHPKKGLLELVEAWRQVGRADWRIVIAGPDEGHLAQVQAQVRRFGLQDQFEFHGEVRGEAKRALFEAADVFVLPTFSENFGVVIPEAMSYGLPVLTTRGAPWSILRDINAGWWVEPGVEGITQGIQSVLTATAEKRAAMGETGRRYVAENLTWDRAGRLAYEAYAWILGLRADRPAHIRVD